MPKKIFLWTAPRCVSTAFERSIMEIKDSKIFHEPYRKSYHFGPERQSPRYTDKPVDGKCSYGEIYKLLTKEYDGVEIVFSKDMAYAIEGHFEELLKKGLCDFQHTFLIRAPMKAIVSLYKASVNKQLTGWSYFDPVEAGYKQMYELYHFIKENLNQQPVIVDADDLLASPARTMEAYCSATNLPFDESMLTWEPGPIPDIWNGWHENVLKSSGFVKQQRKCEDIKSYPKDVQQSIEDSMPHYDFLRSKKINPIVPEIYGG